MRSRAEQPLLQVLPETVVNGERNNQRSDTGRDSDDGNARDDPDKRLAPLGPQVSGCDE